MTYTKPSDKTYTQMCIEFDKEFYEPNRDDNKLYMYLYLIIYMLACKKHYFKNYEDYDGFSLFASTQLYMRFIKTCNNGERIKSVLNYCKACLYALKVQYQNESFQEIINSDKQSFDSKNLTNNLYESVQQDYNFILEDAVKEELENIPILIKEIIDNSSFKDDKLFSHKIYISVLLSFINLITKPNKNKNKKRAIKENLENVESCIILWKLDNSQRNYVQLVLNKVKTKIKNDLYDIRNFYELPEDTLSSILATAYNTYDNDQDLTSGEVN